MDSKVWVDGIERSRLTRKKIIFPPLKSLKIFKLYEKKRLQNRKYINSFIDISNILG